MIKTNPEIQALKKRSGVYMILNNATGKVYVGSTIDFFFRRMEHFSRLRCGKHYNEHLQHSFDKHGESSFAFEILEECQEDILFEREQYWIDTLEVIDPEKGYNKNPLAGKHYNIPIPVAQLSLTGELIEVFPSIKEATIQVAGYDNNNRDDIGAVLRRKQHTAFGYLWVHYREESLKQEIEKFLSEKIGKSLVVEQIDLQTGEILNVFDGIRQAEIAIEQKPNNSTIRNCINGQYKSAHGYFWRRFEYKINRQATYYLGADPGAKGAISLISEDGGRMFSFPIPIDNGGDIDIQRLINFVQSWTGYIKMAAIEDVHSIFGVSAKSNFQFGRNVGLLQGAIAGAQIPFVLVQPKVWQKEAFQGIPVIKKPGAKIEGRGSVDTKGMALVAIKRLFPELKLTYGSRAKKPNDGLIDSMLIARYCKLNF